MTDDSEPEANDPDLVLREQLFQYAEDMRQLMSDHADLGWRYHLLEQAYLSLGGSRAAIDRLADSVDDLYVVTDDRGVVCAANRRTLVRFASSPVFGLPLSELLGAPSDRDAETRHCYGNVQYCLTRCAEPCHLRVLQTLFPGPGGAHWFISDLPPRPQNLGLGTMVTPSADALLVFDAEGHMLTANPVLFEVTGYTAEELIGQPVTVLCGEFGPSLADNDLWAQLQTTGYWHGPLYTRLKNGDMRRDWVVLNVAAAADGRLTSCLAVFSDVLPLRETEQRLAYLAHHDILTGLPNRLLFAERLEQALRQVRRQSVRGAVIFIDLDGFKPVNDTYGHAVGDSLLRLVGQRLVAALRETDTVARLGGDEFAILVQGLKDAQAVATLGQKLLGILLTPMLLGDLSLTVGASIGIALFPDHGEQADLVLSHADSAMYEAKRASGNTYRVYGLAE